MVKKVEIRWTKDKHMIMSEWGIFILGMLFIFGFLRGMLYIAKEYMFNSDLQVIYLIVVMFTLMKILYWIKVPTTYRSSDFIEDFYLESGLDRK